MKKFLIFSLVILLSFTSINIYGTSIDSLRKELTITTVDTVKISHCIRLSKLYNNILADSAKYFAHQAYNISTKKQFKKGIIKSFINLAGIQLKSYPDSSIYYIDKVLPLLELDDYHFFAKAYLNKGVANLYLGNDGEAMKYYKMSAEYAQQCDDALTLAKLYNNMGNLIAMQNSEKAKDYFKKGLAAAEQLNNTNIKGHLLINLGGMYFGEGNYDTAKVMLEKALVIKKLENDLYTQAIIAANLGRIYNQREDYDSSIIVLKEGLKISEKLNFEYGLRHNLQVLQSTYLFKKQYQRSIFYGEEILRQNIGNKDFLLLVDVNSYLAQAAEAMGDYKAAFDYQKTCKIMTDSLNNTAQAETIAKLEAEFKSKEQEQTIKLLEQEKKTKEANNKALLIGVILSIGLLLIALIGYRQKQLYNDRLEKEVEQQTKDLTQKNKQLVKANNDLNQFNYIASHDIKEPIRIIGGYVRLIHQKIPNESKAELKLYFNTIEKGIKQLYTLIEDIMKYTTYSQNKAVDYTNVNLNEVVQNVEVSLEKLINDKNGKITYDNLPTISSNTSILYVALKNLIQNGLQFNESAQPEVKVLCTKTDEFVILKIQDNGIGIEPKYHSKVFEMFKRLHSREKFKTNTGLGLSITKTIIEKINGKITIESEAGNGTTFIVTLPENG